jgi:hypothetical protein
MRRTGLYGLSVDRHSSVTESSLGKSKNARQRLVPALDHLPLTALVPSARWLRPLGMRLSADRKWLEWDGYGDEIRVNQAQENVLAGFVGLAGATPDAVLRFAESWGPLGICAHDKPFTHIPARLARELDDEDFAPCRLRRRGLKGPFREPVERWHHYSAQAAAVHHAAARLLTGNFVEAHIWETLRDLIQGHWVPSDVRGVPGAATNADRLHTQQLVLTFAVQRWLNLGDVRILASWGDNGGAVDFGRDSLFGALALQLALTATRHGGFFRCSHCGDAYIPERRPREGEEHYCRDCRDSNVPGRRRMEKLRQRRALEQQQPPEG